MEKISNFKRKIKPLKSAENTIRKSKANEFHHTNTQSYKIKSTEL